MNEEDLLRALRKALEDHHRCPFSPEDRSILKDIIAVGKTFKKAFIVALALFLIIGTIFMIIHMAHSDAMGACWLGEVKWETSPQTLVGVSLSVSVVVGLEILTFLS